MKHSLPAASYNSYLHRLFQAELWAIWGACKISCIFSGVMGVRKSQPSTRLMSPGGFCGDASRQNLEPEESIKEEEKVEEDEEEDEEEEEEEEEGGWGRRSRETGGDEAGEGRGMRREYEG